MQIFVNGQPRQCGVDLSIAQLLADMQLMPAQLAVEVNMQLVPRADHSERLLCDGDKLEIVTLAGGG